MQFLVGANEQEVDVVAGPAGADLGAVAGDGFAARAIPGEDGMRILPRLRLRICG
jgi:hypothetical protein